MDHLAGRHYEKPPIVEAVAELKFSPPLDKPALERVQRGLKRNYPRSETELRVEVRAKPDSEQVSVHRNPAGFRLTSKQADAIVLLRPETVAMIRLAPYKQWEELKRRTEAMWRVFRKQHREKRVSRVSVRYVNRIDVPAPDGIVDAGKYLNIDVQYPSAIALTKRMAFFLQTDFSHDDERFQVILRTGTAEPTLIGHGALLLDIDVLRIKDVATNDEELWVQFDELRTLKNHVFESCITDKARELFVERVTSNG